MPSILHIADVHLDARLRFLGARGREHRANIRAAFQRCVDEALAHRVDALVIAGDLFDSNRAGAGTVNFVRQQLGRLAAAGVVARIVPGTHDALMPSGVYAWADLESTGSVRVYRGEGPGGWDVERFPSGLTLYARPTLEKGGGLSALAGLPRDPDAVAGCEVALVHAALDLGSNEEEDYILYPDEVAASGLVYVAAGHWHTPRDFSRGATAGHYPGSPEPVSLDPRGPGQALLVHLQPGQPARAEPITVGRVHVDVLEWDATGHDGVDALEAELSRRASSDLILRVRLRGIRGPGWTRTAADLEEAFSGAYFHLVVDDDTSDDVDLASAAGAGELTGTVARRFAQRLDARLQAAPDEASRRRAAEALRLGLALLEGREPW